MMLNFEKYQKKENNDWEKGLPKNLVKDVKASKKAPNLIQSFKDMSSIAKKATELPGDSMSQLQALFDMVNEYSKTNPDEYNAMDDFIGERCKYRDDDEYEDEIEDEDF